MTQTIDSKVVEMKFDNKQFESGVDDTLKSLNKLENSLDFSGSVKGLDKIKNALKGVNFSDAFDGIEEAAGNVKFSGLSTGIETVKTKFSALEAVAVGVFMRIGSQVADTAVDMVKSMSSIDGMTAGWQKYNEKTSSVQTIMAATGKSIDEVDEQLTKLMWYTDETSYDFVDMTSNIGKFTSAGVSLEDATSAMMGISNWAALSGANIQQASHAMYNLSQAMGTGSVKLQDWKSIENANMATIEFKQQVIDTAKAMGTLSDGVPVTAQNFNEFLNQKDWGVWFTNDVLIEVLKKYGEYAEAVYQVSDAYDTCSEAMKHVSDEGMELSAKGFRVAQEAKTFEEAITSVKDAVSSKWMQTFEIMFGNYIEAKELWTDLANSLYDLFALGGDARNEMLQIWKDNGGQKAFIKSLWNIYDTIISIKDTIAGAFRDIFPPMTGKQLAKITKQFQAFTKSLMPSEATLDKLRRSFRGLFALFDIGKQVISAAIKLIKAFIPDVDKNSKGVLDLTAAIGDLLYKFDQWLKEGDKLSKAVKATVDFIKSIPDKIIAAFKKLKSLSFGDIKDGASTAIRKIKDTFSNLDTLSEKFDKIPKAFSVIADKLKIIPELIVTAFNALKDISLPTPIGFLRDKIVSIVDAIKDVDIPNPFAFLKDKIVEAVNDIKNIDFPNPFSSLKGKADDAVDSVKNAFTGFKKTDTSGLDNLTEEVETKTTPLEKALNKLKGIFETFGEAFKKTADFVKKIFDGVKRVFTAFFNFIKDVAVAIGEAFKPLIEAFKESFEIDFNDSQKTLDNLMDIANGGMLAMILVTIKKFVDSISGILKNGEKITSNINKVVKDADGIVKSVTKILDGVQGCLEAWQNNLKAKTLMELAKAILMITIAVTILSTIKIEKLEAALTAVTTEFVELMGSFSLMSKTASTVDVASMEAIAGILTKMATAVLILSMAVKKLSELDSKDMVAGVAGVSGLLTGLTASMVALSGVKDTDLDKAASGIIAMGLALLLMSKAVVEIGKMSLDTVVSGTGAVVLLMTNLAVSSKIIGNNAKGLSEAGIAIIGMAIALRLLVKPIMELGSMDVADIVTGVGAIMAVLTGLTVFIGVTKFDSLGPKIGSALIMIATAIRIMSSAVTAIAAMDYKKVIVGVLAFEVILASISALVAIADGTKGMAAVGAGMIGVAIAMTVLTQAIKMLGSIDPDNLTQGLIGLGAAMIIVALAMSVMEKDVALIGPGLIAAAIALTIMAGALKIVGAMDPKSVAVAVAALAAAMAVLALVTKLASIKGAAALAVAAFGVAELAGALALISQIPWNKLKNGLKAMAIALAAVLVAGLLAIPLAPGLVVLGAVMVALGAAFLMCGIGATMFTTAFIALVATVTGAGISIGYVLSEIIEVIPPFLKAIGQGLVDIAKQLIGSIPSFIEDFKNIIIALIDTILDLAPTIMSAIITLVETLGKLLEPKFPAIVEWIFSLLLAVLGGLEAHAEELATLGLGIITGILEGIANGMPDFIQAAFDLVLAFINGLADALVDNAKALREAIDNLCWAVLDAICEFFGINSPSTVFKDDVGGNMIDGLIQGIGDGISRVVTKIGELCKGILKGIKEFFGKFKDKGIEIVKKIIKGIGSMATDLYKIVSTTIQNGLKAIASIYKWIIGRGKAIIGWIVEGISNAWDSLKNAFVGDDGIITKALDKLNDLWDSFKEIGGYLIDGIIEGIKGAASSLADKVEDVAGDIKDGICSFFGISSPSKVMMEIGGYITEGLAIGIADNGKMATNAITNVSEDVVDSMGGLSSKIADVINSDPDFNPTITPVVDLTNVATGASAINDMLSANQSLALAGSADISVNRKIDDSLSKKLDVNNTDVVKELESLRADMKEMSNAMLQMSIVLDTGTMVGAMAGPMDNVLGRRATLRRRGV